MEYQNLKNCGEVGIEFSTVDAEGTRVSRDFLKELIFNIIRRSTAFYDDIQNPGDHIFSYRERQFHSVVCPSIADITNAFVVEHPLHRKPAGESETRGNVDYFVSYRGYSFLMELKHDYCGCNRVRNPRSTIAEKFDDALTQLNNIRTKEYRSLLNKNKGLIKIALEAIVFYMSSEKILSSDSSKGKDFKKLFDELTTNIAKAHVLNMCALWILNERLVEPWKYPKLYEIYPAVGFIANISQKKE